MARRDRESLYLAIRILAEMALAAGAREVVLPIFGAPTIARRSELDSILHRPPSARRAECVAFHPLGSAKMSAHAADGVVDPRGRVWGTEGLYVADGSILPTSIGVNSQLPIMAVARKIAHELCDGWPKALTLVA